MQPVCPLVVKRLARLRALLFQPPDERPAARLQEFHYLLNLALVFTLRASRQTGRQTLMHLRVDAAGRTRIGMYILIAPSELEEIQGLGYETLCGGAGGEGSVVNRAIVGQPPRRIAAGKRVAEVNLEQCGWPQA